MKSIQPYSFLLIRSVLLITSLVISFKSEISSQGGFQKKFGNVWISNMIPSADGGYALSGWHRPNGHLQGGVLIKLDAAGDTMWTRILVDTISSNFSSLDQTSDGGFILVGKRYKTYGSTDILLTKTDDAGRILWVKRIDYGDYENGRDIAETVDGGFILTGELTRDSLNLHYDVFVIRTNENGEILWSKSYQGPGNTQGFKILELPGGDLIVHGVINIGSENPDILTMRLDSSGDTIWTRSYGGPEYERSYTLTLTSHQELAVAGLTSSYCTGYGDTYITLLGMDGNLHWSKSYGNIGGDQGNAITETRDGGFIFGGNSLGSFEPDGCRYILKTNSAGDVQWSMSYSDGASDDITSIIELETGEYLVTGHNENFMKLTSGGNMGCHQKNAPTITLDAPTQFYNHLISIHDQSPQSLEYSLTELRGLQFYESCETLGTTKPLEVPSIIIFPNPAQDVVYLQSNGSPLLQAQLVDISGKPSSHVVHHGSALIELNVSDLPPGVYTIHIETTKGWVFHKLVK